ncbi:MAG: hypothetical protein EOP38_09560 [Rubrivivax sp.]|nr:MAG: hypothetical protein EOP38_09560 [Rubrivivax sp.]
MTSPRLPLFERLPEIYRIRDTEQTPPGQLQAFLGVIEDAMAALHARTDAQYHDLFIEHCDDWVVAYIADLLGTTRLSGDPWTLRADVARTVFHRRRKGTLGAVESQVFTLSGWAAHAVEMRERLGWNQHLNHQRPDAGGTPPLKLRTDPRSPVRGGMATLRDPALLSLVGGAFDPFARVVDVKPPTLGMSGWNLPNLAILLWRLEDFQVPLSRPVFRLIAAVPPAPGGAALAVRFDVQAQGEPWPLFNTHRFHADDDPPRLGSEDEVPGPMPTARLTEGTPAGRPNQYVSVQTYADPRDAHPGPDAVGLVLHLPEAPFLGQAWRIRGANLCAWEAGLAPPLRAWEVVVDPQRGRLVFGVPDANAANQAQPLADGLLVSATHALAGPTGAQPVKRSALPATWPAGQAYELKRINWFDDPLALQQALDDLPARTTPLVIEITDSQTHVLDLNAINGIGNDAGVLSMRLAQSLWIRGAAGQRPVIRLRQPLRWRPTQITGPGAVNVEQLEVTLEGLYLTRDAAFPVADALIMQAALGALNLLSCTLDPGGGLVLDGTETGSRAPVRQAVRLTNDYGLANPELGAFDQVPALTLSRCITGPLAIDTGHLLTLSDTIVDAGSGIAATTPALAIGAATGNPELDWGPDLVIQGVTVLGRSRVQTARGESGLFVHRLEVHDNQDSHTVDAGVGQRGSCLKFCWFSGQHDRLPQHFGCVFGPQARLRFTAEWFGRPGYAQLRPDCDRRIREDGSHSDEMGAFGYLLNTHKWKNIGIRLREFMPVGVRPVLIPIT